MDSLAYLHLALVYEGVDTSSDRPLSGVNWSKLSTNAFIHFLSIALSLGILSIAVQASAAIQRGDSGPEVTEVQERLRQLRYFETTPTGYFGSVTEKSVKRLQRNCGLKADGIVGTSTYNCLFSVRNTYYNPGQTQPYNYYPILQRGDNGKAVLQLKQWLAVNGYTQPTLNEDFDIVTEAELRRFQREHRLVVTGVADKTTWITLVNYGYNYGYPIPTEVSSVGRLPLSIPLTPPFPESGLPSTNFNPEEISLPNNCGLQICDRGSAVATLQRYLILLNYLQGTPTGYYGSSTKEAIRRFQRDNNLYATGIADPETQRILLEKVSSCQQLCNVQNSDGEFPLLQEGATGKTVRYLQQRLKATRFYNGRITGNFGSKTRTAVMKLQEFCNLDPTGVVDSTTWGILNSGSNIGYFPES
jgi:peptidoglycan hydrolase-like protein with peptidoglycan-binding domain